MSVIGYAHLVQSLDLPVFKIKRPARIAPVTRVSLSDKEVSVPRHVAPRDNHPLSHVLFALKHEGVNLQVLSHTLCRISSADMLAELRKSPTGQYIRTACYLWEHFNRAQLDDIPPIAGKNVNLFDESRYITASPVRNARWRVNFNGIGSLDYCPTVERTQAVEEGVKSNILGAANAFLRALKPGVADRALAWAYLHETESSFEIERETPSESKSEAFVELLKRAHDKHLLSEDFLSDMQASVVTNPFDRAVSFRGEQNWLRGPLRGAAGVTYVPPPPEDVPSLMASFMEMANRSPLEIDPLIAAAVTSFGFVFIHPFMDGNGRLSRFLFHHALCLSGKLEYGHLLPVSIAMKRNEQEYLMALQSFSKETRAKWDVRWIDEGQYAFSLKGDATIYRYWDATSCVEFGFRMAKQALEIDIKSETQFLERYDTLIKYMNDRFDIRNNDLATLVIACLQNDGVVSKNHRKKFSGRVPEAAFDDLEEFAASVLSKNSGIDTAQAPRNETPKHDEGAVLPAKKHRRSEDNDCDP